MGQVLMLQQLADCVPGCPAALVGQYFPYIASALAEFGIGTPLRVAAWLAQCGHESSSFRQLTELWGPTPAQVGYSYRKDLGNTQDGDGFRFRGRGVIQITGRSNYAAASQALGVDLVNQPELASSPPVAFRLGGWFWYSRNLNLPADQGTQAGFDVITKRINGGYNGKADRDARYVRCKGVLCSSPS